MFSPEAGPSRYGPHKAACPADVSLRSIVSRPLQRGAVPLPRNTLNTLNSKCGGLRGQQMPSPRPCPSWLTPPGHLWRDKWTARTTLKAACPADVSRRSIISRHLQGGDVPRSETRSHLCGLRILGYFGLDPPKRGSGLVGNKRISVACPADVSLRSIVSRYLQGGAVPRPGNIHLPR